MRSTSLLAALAVVGCSASTEPVGSASASIIDGTPSNPSQDAVVLIQMPNGGECTGTILSPSIILTARHCVAETDAGALCSSEGRALNGGAVYKNLDAKQMIVNVGLNRNGAMTAAKGDHLVDTKAKTLCNQDIALIVLAKPLANPPIQPVRLDGPPVKGEKMISVGWGVSEKTVRPMTRLQRAGVVVDAVGPLKRSIGDLGKNEFEVGESICLGDSGGPALAAETGAVIGVVSRGGNGNNFDAPQDIYKNCIDSSNLARNIYTQVAPFKDMIVAAAEAAGEELWVEGGPDPRLAKFGDECEEDSACRSGVCLAGSCSQECESECPDGYSCQTQGDRRVCAIPGKGKNGATTTTTSCAASPGTGSGGALFLLSAASLFFFSRRRRK